MVLRRLWTLLGIAGDIHFLWFTLGFGTVVSAVATAALATVIALPWWAALAIFVGFALILVGIAQFAVERIVTWRAERSGAQPVSPLAAQVAAPPAMATDLGQRLQRALDDLITRNYKDDPRHVLSDEGLKNEPAWDVYRHDIYDKLGITDLFAPDPRQGRVLLRAKIDGGTELANWMLRVDLKTLSDDPQAIIGKRVHEWDDDAAKAVEFYLPARASFFRSRPRPTLGVFDARPMWLSGYIKFVQAKIERLERLVGELGG